jgi:hypothetical protein
LYTFPLGIWDRFFVSPVDEERTLISKLTDVDSEFFKISQNLPIDQMLAVTLSVRAKKIALLERDKALVLKWRGSLTGNELELLAYHAHSVGYVELAQILYETSLSKAKAEKNPFLVADIYRMRAPLFATKGTTATNPAEARKDYTLAVEGFLNMAQYYTAALAIWDWANFEVSEGSKPCAYFLAEWAIQTVAPLEPQRAQQWAQAFQGQRNKDTEQKTQPTGSCGKDTVSFDLSKASPPTMTAPAGPESPLAIAPKQPTSR